MPSLLDPRNPLRRAVSAEIRTAWRELSDWRRPFATECVESNLPVLLLHHSSPIHRRLPGVNPLLFENKRINLALALRHLDGLCIPSGATFSFWHALGRPSKRRGFREGLVIRGGRAAQGIGGGLCQLSNAIFWLALHSDLTVLERHRHSFDLFPDDHRRIPFGTGATVAYKYKDLRLFNSTTVTYQYRFKLSAEALHASLRTSAPPAHPYRIVERDHEFKERKEGLYRQNKIVRQTLGARNRVLREEILFSNSCLCQYKEIQ